MNSTTGESTILPSSSRNASARPLETATTMECVTGDALPISPIDRIVENALQRPQQPVIHSTIKEHHQYELAQELIKERNHEEPNQHIFPITSEQELYELETEQLLENKPTDYPKHHPNRHLFPSILTDKDTGLPIKLSTAPSTQQQQSNPFIRPALQSDAYCQTINTPAGIIDQQLNSTESQLNQSKSRSNSTTGENYESNTAGTGSSEGSIESINRNKSIFQSPQSKARLTETLSNFNW